MRPEHLVPLHSLCVSRCNIYLFCLRELLLFINRHLYTTYNMRTRQGFCIDKFCNYFETRTIKPTGRSWWEPWILPLPVPDFVPLVPFFSVCHFFSCCFCLGWHTLTNKVFAQRSKFTTCFEKLNCIWLELSEVSGLFDRARFFFLTPFWNAPCIYLLSWLFGSSFSLPQFVLLHRDVSMIAFSFSQESFGPSGTVYRPSTPLFFFSSPLATLCRHEVVA